MTHNKCYHCDEQIPDHFEAQVLLDGTSRNTCCFGCQAVMQSIIDGGLADYYRFRTATAALGKIPDDLDAQLEKLSVFDEPEFTEQLLVGSYADNKSANAKNANAIAEITVSVEGIRCGACVWLLERSLRSMHGVVSVSVNGSTYRSHIKFDRQKIKLSSILQKFQRVGYAALPLDVHLREKDLTGESRIQIQRLFVAGIGMMQVMMFALPGYITDTGEMSPVHQHLLQLASMVLTIPVVLFSSRPFFKAAIRSIKAGNVGMDLPVSIGIIAAFGFSVWSVISKTGETYFDTVSMFVFLLLLARYLEWSIRCRSLRSIDDLTTRSVDTAFQLHEGEYIEVPATRLSVGDTIRVSNGDNVPVDGLLISGSSLIDCSILTGESIPICVNPNDHVPGGAQVLGAPITLQVAATKSHSTLSVIGGLIERGSTEKPHLVNAADRVARYFIWCLLGFSCVVFAVWWGIDPERAATIAITVLVVSCPCALSLATPTALAASTARLIDSRLLITRGHGLESAAAITDVVFDKTGTLTKGVPKVTEIQLGDDQQRDTVLAVAAQLEEGASHPFAASLRELARDSVFSDIQIRIKQNSIHHETGAGVSAVLEDGGSIRIGSKAWCKLDELTLSDFNRSQSPATEPSSTIYLCQSHDQEFNSPAIMARFSLKDTLRDESVEVVRYLKKSGLKLHLLSGDQQPVVEQCANHLGIKSWTANARPQDKQSYVRALQSAGRRVLMIGDGVNDAPVLASADVSVAIGNATSLAQTSADAISLANGLSALPLLVRQARRTSVIIKQNLAWALIYNSIAIPAASLGLVSPWLAAAGMALSSMLVAGNAARLWLGRREPASEDTISAATGPLAWNH